MPALLCIQLWLSEMGWFVSKEERIRRIRNMFLASIETKVCFRVRATSFAAAAAIWIAKLLHDVIVKNISCVATHNFTLKMTCLPIGG